jgi:NADPH2:quinone reductase
VVTIGEMDEPQPLAGEVRIRVAASGINPGDVKKRQNAFGVGMPYPRIIPLIRHLWQGGRGLTLLNGFR